MYNRVFFYNTAGQAREHILASLRVTEVRNVHSYAGSTQVLGLSRVLCRQSMFICFGIHSTYGRSTVPAIKVNFIPITASLLHNERFIDSTNNSSALTVAVCGID